MLLRTHSIEHSTPASRKVPCVCMCLGFLAACTPTHTPAPHHANLPLPSVHTGVTSVFLLPCVRTWAGTSSLLSRLSAQGVSEAGAGCAFSKVLQEHTSNPALYTLKPYFIFLPQVRIFNSTLCSDFLLSKKADTEFRECLLCVWVRCLEEIVFHFFF